MTDSIFDVFKVHSITFDEDDSWIVEAIVFMTESPSIDKPTPTIEESIVKFTIVLDENAANIYRTADCEPFDCDRSYVSAVLHAFTKEFERADMECRANSGDVYDTILDHEDPVTCLKPFEVHY